MAQVVAHKHSTRAMLTRLAKDALLASGALRLKARVKRPAALILMYHSVRQDPAQDQAWIAPGITHSTRVFTRHMELVAQRFNPVSLDDILLFLRGDAGLPRRAVAVTFDDGFVDNVEEAAPVLQRVGIPAAFYLVSSAIGNQDVPWYCRVRHAFLSTRAGAWDDSELTWNLMKPASRGAAMQSAYDGCSGLAGQSLRDAVERIERDLGFEGIQPPRRLMMSWEEAESLRRAGHIVGSHTMSHPNLAYVESEEVLRAELGDSKYHIEEHLNAAVVHFSYPHPALSPQWNQRTLELARQIGYRSAATTTRGPVRADADPLLLSRIGAPHPDHEFLWALERAFSS
jgi:peptidoglycan/xylan/chitin deacetylase (PgdA/CDA1 family)